ncbi:hypothetical protein Btru_071233 [Bulinus truncatus]|nr:hypothetical protein Btru_071233 [Bulinus truncatus]
MSLVIGLSRNKSLSCSRLIGWISTALGHVTMGTRLTRRIKSNRTRSTKHSLYIGIHSTQHLLNQHSIHSTQHSFHTALAPLNTQFTEHSHHSALTPHSTRSTQHSHHSALTPHSTQFTQHSLHTAFTRHNTHSAHRSQHTALHPTQHPLDTGDLHYFVYFQQSKYLVTSSTKSLFSSIKVPMAPIEHKFTYGPEVYSSRLGDPHDPYFDPRRLFPNGSD